MLLWKYFLEEIRSLSICKQKRALSPGAKLAGTLILDLPAFRTMRNTYLLFKPPSLWYFLEEVQTIQNLVKTAHHNGGGTLIH